MLLFQNFNVDFDVLAQQCLIQCIATAGCELIWVREGAGTWACDAYSILDLVFLIYRLKGITTLSGFLSSHILGCGMSAGQELFGGQLWQYAVLISRLIYRVSEIAV
jgi:hypothetical protein